MLHFYLLNSRICVPWNRCKVLESIGAQNNYKEKLSAGEAGKGGHLLYPVHILSNLLYYIYLYILWKKN